MVLPRVSPDPDLHLWADRIRLAAASHSGGLFSRVMVLAETDSTMDPARADGSPGLIVVAGRQTAGRGRLGRAWADTRGLGLAVTFTLDAERFDASLLSIASGLASHAACAAAAPGVSLGVRWPNDVVERRTPSRKLAGVLIERAGDVALLGIGINVLQQTADFPETIRGRAASLAMVGSRSGRLDVLESLIVALAESLGRPMEENAQIWSEHDVLLGTRRVFEHAGRRYEGVVESVKPTSHIQLRTAEGATVTLPALTTSMVHDA